MVGFIFGLLYLAFSAFVQGRGLEPSFLSASEFLYFWYIFWSIPLLFIIGVTVFGMTAGAAAVGGALGGRSTLGKTLGALGGVAVGGGTALGAFGLGVARIALCIGGAWLLKTSGTPDMSFAEFDLPRLVIGGLMVVSAIVMTRMINSRARSRSST